LSTLRIVWNYIEVLKPGPTLLLTYIGLVAAFVAANGSLHLGTAVIVGATALSASAGANGLTNYLDRDIDARMRRARHRALPSKRINPPEKVLPLTIGLVAFGLVLSWQLQPVLRLAFVADVLGTTAALVWRKRATCVFPQGLLAGCAPVLIGWLAVSPAFSWEPLLLCGMIGVWLPLHVWSVMIRHRDDYIQAGLTYFPMSREVKEGVRVLVVFSLVLAVISLALWLVGGFSALYLMAAIIMSGFMVFGAFRLLASSAAAQAMNAWRLYKLSSYPYLGLIFLAMGVDVLLR
jgi:protoheme IX farnesyltransferase